MLRTYGVHPVERSGADIEAFRTAQGILEAGQALLIFPEGTRSRDGSLQKPRDGLAMLALRTGAPIVPIGVADTDKVWPRDRKPRPWPGGHVTVRVGTPFRVEDEIPADLDRKTAKSRATDVIMRRIAALLPERQRGPVRLTFSASLESGTVSVPPATHGGCRGPMMPADRRSDGPTSRGTGDGRRSRCVR